MSSLSKAVQTRCVKRQTVPPSERHFPLLSHNLSHDNGRKRLAGAAPAPVSAEQWQNLLGLLATGTKVSAAIEALGVDPVALEGLLRGEPVKHRAWREALIAADRRGWPVELIEDICADVANKKTLKAACASHGKEARIFLQMARRDPTVKEMYEEARTIASELEGDELREIADDDSNDLTLDGKGNTASVNRSKLQVETRFRLMSSYNRQRFGEEKTPAGANVTVNINHADRLESARARSRKVEVIEGSAIELLPPPDGEDTAWLD